MRRSTTVTDRAPAGRAARPVPPGPRTRGRRRRRRAAVLLGVLVVLGAALAGWYQVHQSMPAWYARLWYPLEYEDTIAAEAQRNRLDPALVAAVINTESGFAPDSRSSQGAIGLMQLQEDTADFLAARPDRPSPAPRPLEDPVVNITYGTAYLRYLVDEYGTVPLALAAYNGGPTNLTNWIEEAAARGEDLDVPEDIPFTETRGFVTKVLDAVPIYRRAYGDRLDEALP